MKKLSDNQLVGQRGEHLVAARVLSMGFSFEVRNRLETGIDGFLELRDIKTGQTLGQWVGIQVKTTEAGNYSYETEQGFEYLLQPDDLSYWRGSNIPVAIVLVRLSDDTMYWKSVGAGELTEPRRLHFDKTEDRLEKTAADEIAALCVARGQLGSFVPPMQSGERAHLTMIRVILPDITYVGASLFGSGRDAARELAGVDPRAPFDWVIRDRRFISFRDPRGTALTEIVDEASVEEMKTEALALTEDIDEEYVFIDLLSRTLSAQFDDELSYDRQSRALYFRALEMNTSRRYYYRSLVNETSAEVVSVWKTRDGRIGSVRHHAFIPRFFRLADDWFLSVAPTFVFTRDGHRAHYNSSGLIAGKKKKEKNGAVRGQFVMWRHLLLSAGLDVGDLLTVKPSVTPPLRFESVEEVVMPLAVPEDAWRKDDPNAENMVDAEWLL